MLHAPKLSQVELVLVFSHYSVVSWVFWHGDCASVTPVLDMKNLGCSFL